MSPEGEQRPCYDAIRLQKIMLKFKGVKRVHVQKYSQDTGNITVYYSYYCLMRYTCGLY